jgi:hypothetical protein
MEDASRSPALRAAHDRVMAVVPFDSIQFAGNQIERPLPRHRHEAFAAAAFATAWTAGEPAFTHHRLSDTGQ